MATTTSDLGMADTASRTQPSHDEAVLVLDDSGTICGCDDAAEVLLKYSRNELIDQHVSLVLPELSFVQEGGPTPRIRFLCHIGHRFRLMSKDGQCFFSQLFLNCRPIPGANGNRVTVSMALR